MLNTVRRFIYTKYWGILYVEHCRKIYLHKILGNSLCWTQWEDLFTQNTGKYLMLNTVGRFIYTKYWEYFMLNTVRRFIYKKYWGILYVEHCEKIYLHKILGVPYLMMKTVGRVDYTDYMRMLIQNTGGYLMMKTGRGWLHKILGIPYFAHCGSWFQNILENTIHNMQFHGAQL